MRVCLCVCLFVYCTHVFCVFFMSVCLCVPVCPNVFVFVRMCVSVCVFVCPCVRMCLCVCLEEGCVSVACSFTCDFEKRERVKYIYKDFYFILFSCYHYYYVFLSSPFGRGKLLAEVLFGLRRAPPSMILLTPSCGSHRSIFSL